MGFIWAIYFLLLHVSVLQTEFLLLTVTYEIIDRLD